MLLDLLHVLHPSRIAADNPQTDVAEDRNIEEPREPFRDRVRSLQGCSPVRPGDAVQFEVQLTDCSLTVEARNAPGTK